MRYDQKLSFKELWRLTKRGYQLQWKINRPFFLSRLLSAAFQAIQPFAALWFSAKLLNALMDRQQIEMLIFWAALAAATAFLLSVIGKTLERWNATNQLTFWHRTEHLYTEKMLSMDYEDVERTEIHTLRSQIDQNDNYNSYGLNILLWSLQELIAGMVGVAASIGLTWTLFTSKTVPAFSMAWVNSPFAAVGVLIAIFAAVAVSVKLGNIAIQTFHGATAMEEIKKGNRIWIYYGFRLPDETRVGMDLRMYQMQSGIREAMARHVSEDTRFHDDIAKIRGRCSGGTQLTGFLCYGLSYLYAALKAMGGAFPLGNLVQYVGGIYQLSENARKLATVCSQIIGNGVYLNTTFEFLDIENKKYRGTIPVEKRCDNEYEFEFRDVSFCYPGSDTYALKHVNMKFKVGQRMAVVGMNGSGKTTMIKLLSRLYDPNEGEILLNGISIQKYDYDEYLSLFSVVFQDFRLFSFTLGENVASRRTYDREKAEICLRKAGFGARLDTLPNGLDTYLNQDFDRSGVEMSGGEAQKIALARALYKEAPFVILDEPTAALDPVAEYEVYTKFDELMEGRTAIYISHRLSSCRFCDVISVFHEGRLIQFGTHEDLLAETDRKYAELWNAQAQYYIRNE